jgi:hypothetical protein
VERSNLPILRSEMIANFLAGLVGTTLILVPQFRPVTPEVAGSSPVTLAIPIPQFGVLAGRVTLAGFAP